MSTDQPNVPEVTDVFSDYDERVPSEVDRVLSRADQRGDDPHGKYLYPNDVARYAKTNCDQFYKYRIEKTQPRSGHAKGDYDDAFKNQWRPISTAAGNRFESAVVDYFDSYTTAERITPETAQFGVEPESELAGDGGALTISASFDYMLDRIQDLHGEPDAQPVIFEQWRLGGILGVWPIAGKSDLIFLLGTEHGVRLHVIDVKSGEEKPHHRVQVAVYTSLIREWLTKYGPDRDIEASITGGIITHETDLNEIDLRDVSSLPSFDLAAVEHDVWSLLAHRDDGGQFHELVWTDQEDINYQLDEVCYSCKYNEECYTHSFENLRTALFGIGGARQHQLAQAGDGLEDVTDIAEMADVPEYPSLTEPLQDGLDIDPEFQNELEDLQSHAGMTSQMYDHIQQAQAITGRLQSDNMDGFTAGRPYWKIGSGRAALPDDTPYGDIDIPYGEGNMIRVYFHVQYDYWFDRVSMLSAAITATNRNGQPLRISKLISDIPDADDSDYDSFHEHRRAYTENERDLIDRFLTGGPDEPGVLDAIETVADEVGLDDLPLHTYFYTDKEFEDFCEALDRHAPHIAEASSLRDMLDLREQAGTSAYDQEIVSILRDEVTSHVNLPFPHRALLAVYDELWPSDDRSDDAIRPRTGWIYTDSDGNRVNLSAAFNHRLFNQTVEFIERDGSIDMLYGDRRGDGDDRSFVPARPERGAQIPLAYIWAVHDQLNAEQLVNGETTANQIQGLLRRYRYRSYASNADDDPITKEDVRALGKRFAHTLAHVEGAFDNAETDGFIAANKEPIPRPQLRRFDIGPSTLARGAREYLRYEYYEAEETLNEHYRTPAMARPLSGESVVVNVQDFEPVGDGDGAPYILRGTLPYADIAHYPDEDLLMNRIRVKDGGEGTGEYMIANPLQDNIQAVAPEPQNPSIAQSDTDPADPEKVSKGGNVEVQRLDITTNPPEITLLAKNYYFDYDDDDPANEFVSHSHNWMPQPTIDDRWGVALKNGWYILDPSLTGIQQTRMIDLMDQQHNELAQILADAETGREPAPQSTAFDEGAVEDFTSWVSDTVGPGGLPNNEQQEFIEKTEQQVSLLQGPPGTGKTAGALAPAVLSREYARASSREESVIAVLGPSNKAIDEALDDTAKLYREFAEHAEQHPTVDGDALDDTIIVRLAGNLPDPGTDTPPDEEPFDMVSYVSYHGAGDGVTIGDPPHQYDGVDLYHEVQQRIHTRSSAQSGLSEAPGVIIFGTASRFRKFIDGFVGQSRNDGMSASDHLEAGHRFFDAVFGDEASMLTVPQMLSVGGFLRPEGQLLLSGDHRQMPPVSQFEWDEETRQTITETAPYLSALDRCRVIAGQEVPALEPDDLPRDPDADFGFTQLSESHRCHEVVTEFLGGGVYQQDNLSFNSNNTDTIVQTEDPNTTAIEQAMAPEYPLVLITHDEGRSQQANPAEAAQVAALLSALDPENSAGVVSPHNAQRSLIDSGLTAAPVEAEADVDTVERFQGGERDAIVVSATASDESYLSSRSDFILDPRRLNVAMSRMRQKLVVIAGQDIFRTVPRDKDTYDRATLWKDLRMFAGGASIEGRGDRGPSDIEPDWSGTIGEMIGDVDLNFGQLQPYTADGGLSDEVNINMYVVSRDHLR